MVQENAQANRKAILDREDDPIHYNYYKYISVVPHAFIDTTVANDPVDYRSYSYALTINKKSADKQPSLNMVMMIFEFSPVSMQISKSNS